MNLLPKASGSRPRLACEIAAGAVVAAQSPEPGMPLAAVAKVELSEGAVTPGLKPGNIADRVAVIAALRRAMEQVGGRANARNGDLTLVVPDGAVRVLLLDFDVLPNKLSEALPIVRFRLKKLVPFEADDAMISFQVMSTSRTLVRVLAVAIPRDVLSEYESVAREAGFEPGAVLPSTLSALAALHEGEGASLVVNANPAGVTTAIVRAGIVLLHRTVDLVEQAGGIPGGLPPALFDPSGLQLPTDDLMPLIDRELSAGEWAAQQPLPEHGRSAFGSSLDRETAEPAPASRSPYLDPTLTANLNAELHYAILDAPVAADPGGDPAAVQDWERRRSFGPEDAAEPAVHTLAPDLESEEIARAVSVAVAYFEDSLGAAPEVVLSAGPLGADGLSRSLREQGVAAEGGLRVRELLDAEAIASGAVRASVQRGWLASVAGALNS